MSINAQRVLPDRGTNPPSHSSRPLCCLALSIRAAMSVFLGLARRDFGYFKRVAGNFAGFLMAPAQLLRVQRIANNTSQYISREENIV